MPLYELHVGSAAFWKRASGDMAAAKNRVLIQAMTFEGDAAGLAVADAIAASPARERRVLVDDYTRHVINDTFLSLSRDPALWAEAQATWAMFDRMQASGTRVRVTNPVGRNPLVYPLRNHKKLLVMDDVVWLGGINFSEHNFAWHDMMVRIENAAVADWLAGEFDADWRGEPAPTSAVFAGGLEIASMSGVGNEAAFSSLLDLFAGARETIEVVSAYPTFPFVDALAQSARRGVDVTLYTPKPNNKPIVRDYLLGIARSSGLRIRLMPEMTHVKAALIDGEVLIAGSSNFDFVSYRTNAEYVMATRDAGLIDDFVARLLAPASAASIEPDMAEYPMWRCRGAGLALKAADVLVSRLRHGKRIAEWQGRATPGSLAGPDLTPEPSA